MKKLLCIILCAGCLILALSACNEQIIDFNYHFNYAYVRLPNGEIVEGKIKSWKDWNDSDMLQVTFYDDSIYYSHSTNIVLVSK